MLHRYGDYWRKKRKVLEILWTELWPTPFIRQSPNPNVVTFGDRTAGDNMEVRPLCNGTGVLGRRGHQRSLSL